MASQDRLKKIRITIATQQLELLSGDRVVAQYPVSTASNGVGEENGSGCTPRGTHKVRIKIGDDQPENTVFVGRRATGEIYSRALSEQYPERDWVLTRILWLTGIEPGKNRFGNRDTLRRYIYIHGCPNHEPMGIPNSHGCIRMRNRDLIALYDQVDIGTEVEIIEGYCT